MLSSSVFFLFPPAIPANAVTVNYTVCVIFLILAVSGITWLVSGRKHYTGPRDIDGLLALARGSLHFGEVVDDAVIATTYAEKTGQPVIKESVVV